MRNRVVGAGMVAMVLALVPDSTALACSCSRSPPPTAALDQATMVFSGRVAAIEDPYDGAIIRSSADPVDVTLAVDRVWKGDVGPTVGVRTARSGASCGFSFQEGESYLVYTHDSFVSLCSRTASLARASEDLAALGMGSAPTAKIPDPSDGDAEDPSPEPDAGTAVDEDDSYKRCPAGTETVEERLAGLLDAGRLYGTEDRGCVDCTLVRCQTEPRHGPFVSHYPDGSIHMQGFYKNGKREGAWTSWHPNGTKHYEGTWHEDHKYGLWKFWRENGHQEAEREYTDDEFDGRWMLWHENGQPNMEGAYKQGERVGMWRIWDEDGTLKAEGPGGKAPAPTP